MRPTPTAPLSRPSPHGCQAAGISPARGAIARMATILLTFQRDNLLQDPSYGLVTSWERLMEEAAAEIDQTHGRDRLGTGLARQLRLPACVYPDVPCPG